MKKTVKILVLSLLYSFAIHAQEKTVTNENAVNEQFGTLLETLLVDGKIDEAGAKSYLETIYGYDQSVSSYLQTADFKTILNLKQGSLTFDDYIQRLNTGLVDFLPSKYQQELAQNIKGYTMMKGAIDEIAAGKIGENSFQLIDGIIQAVKENNERIEKEKIILGKIKAITPTITSLDKSLRKNFIKKKISVPFSDKEWRQIPSPDWSKKTGRLNKAVLTDNGLAFEGEWQNFAPPTYQFFNYFKNTEKFDFSKDFKAEFEITVDNSRTYNFFEIQLAGMYRMSLMCYQKGKTKAFTITTPKEYFLTNKFGVFYNSQDAKQFGFKSSIIKQNKNACVDYTKPVKITMQKIGNKLTFQFNDCTEVTEIEMNYFFNKYLIEFRAEGNATLHKMSLEHL